MKVDKQQHDREDGGKRLKVSVHVFFPIPRFFLVSQAIYQSVVLLFFQETSNIFHLISHGPVFQEMRLVREVPGKEKKRDQGLNKNPMSGVSAGVMPNIELMMMRCLVLHYSWRRATNCTLQIKL